MLTEDKSAEIKAAKGNPKMLKCIILSRDYVALKGILLIAN